MGKVFFIGDVALDEYYRAPFIPTLKDKITVETLPAQMGGMIANAACVYAGYGEQVEFCAVLNQSPVSDLLCNHLEECGVHTGCVVRDDTLPDSKTIILLAEEEHLVIIPTMNVEKLTLTQEIFEALCHADLVYSNICESRVLQYQGMDAAAVLQHLKACGVLLAFDLDVADFKEGDRAYLKYIDILFVNEIGFGNLYEEMPEEAVVQELFRNGTKVLVVTLAEKGCDVYYGEKKLHVPGISVPVADVTGAGDTFCSSFVYVYLKTKDIELAARFATYAAAKSVMGMGARSGVSDVTSVLEFAGKYDEKAAAFDGLKEESR